MKNSKVYCLIRVCSCFVIIFYVYIFQSRFEQWDGGGSYGMAGGCFTDVLLRISQNYHQEHATEPRQLSEDVMATWGAVILCFHRVANLYKQ